MDIQYLENKIIKKDEIIEKLKSIKIGRGGSKASKIKDFVIFELLIYT